MELHSVNKENGHDAIMTRGMEMTAAKVKKEIQQEATRVEKGAESIVLPNGRQDNFQHTLYRCIKGAFLYQVRRGLRSIFPLSTLSRPDTSVDCCGPGNELGVNAAWRKPRTASVRSTAGDQ